jgi:hypothetical protein
MQMVLEILQRLVCLLGPLELVVELEQFEEGKSPFFKSGDESIQSCHTSCELLDVLYLPWSTMAVMALIFSEFASIPRWLTMNPSSFPCGTPKTHFIGLSFHQNRRKLLNVSSR